MKQATLATVKKIHTVHLTSLSLSLVGLLSVVSCGSFNMSPEDKHLERALKMAGENRRELEKVLDHYSGDPERYEAARWLISNMPLHHSKAGPELEKYRRYYEVAADQPLAPNAVRDSLDSICGAPDLTKINIVYDIQTLDSAYIVENIDAAFEAREKYPWGKNVRWEDFLEFVLPYRLGDESLTQWRKPILQEYGDLIDSIASLPESVTPRIASDLLYKEWIWRKNFKWTTALPIGPRIGPAIVEWKIGTCREKADGMAYLLRAAGLPAALHISSLRGDLNDTHSWGAVYDSDGSPWLPEQYTDSAYKSKVPAAKVQCETFSINHSAPLYAINTRLANPCMTDPFRRDETKWYLKPEKRKHFMMPLSNIEGVIEGDTVYIALSSRMEWVPVGMGVAQNDSVDFGYVGDRTVCVAGVMRNGKFHVRSYPFKTTVPDDGSLELLLPGERKQINIYSKHNIIVGDFSWRMINGSFETSDSPDFSTVDTLHRIRESPKRLLTSVDVTDSGKHRYVRYMSADKTRCNVALIAFYGNRDDTVPLAGRIINAPGFHPTDEEHDFRNAWDGDPYTSVDLREESGGWTGLDLKKPRKIEKIVYSPRNRGNYIHCGHTYELFYFKGKDGWQSLGTKEAESDMITMEAPSGALLYLHCLDGGRDERIFEYDITNDLQMYW